MKMNLWFIVTPVVTACFTFVTLIKPEILIKAGFRSRGEDLTLERLEEEKVKYRPVGVFFLLVFLFSVLQSAMACGAV